MPAFRFLHASDFHLERPPGGLAELPEHLREVFLEAPYQAARNVFSAALEHTVDIVLLAGDIVCPQTSSPRALLFLREQFERLAQEKIEVYWVGGPIDRPHEWPDVFRWPENVHLFAPKEVTHYRLVRGGSTLCQILGQSWSADNSIEPERFVPANADVFSIGLAYGELNEDATRSHPIRYWALGGEHEPTLPQDTAPIVHYAGSPQGRSPDEAGPHGCTLVNVDETGRIRTMPLSTDVVRYLREAILVSASTTRETLEAELRQRIQTLIDAHPNVALAITFALEAEDGRSFDSSLAMHLPALIGILRGEFGYRTPPAWVAEIQTPPPGELPRGWYDQETLLGDFLRAARRLQTALQEPIAWDRYLPATHVNELVELLTPGDAYQRHRALQEASHLGASLLHPEEVRP